jgi:ethanolamine ammonia-lyase large subunit
MVQGIARASGQEASMKEGIHIDTVLKGEDVFSYINRLKGGFDRDLYRGIVGAANEFKEGDRIVGVAADGDESRRKARELLANTRIGDIGEHPLFDDTLYDTITAALDPGARKRVSGMTLGELRLLILQKDEPEIRVVLDGLPSDAVGCLVKIMNNEDLTAAGRKIFNTLPGTMMGGRGYMGARIQPNSPTDDPEDIFWEVMSAFSYAVGDIVIGTNPVSSEPESVSRVEDLLLDIRRTFGIEDIIPHSVLSHIDIQALVEKQQPGTTGIWFQSIAGSTAVNNVFDLTLDKLVSYAAIRTGKYGFYFETGQGADFTNGHGMGTDMVIHESRKYGLARFLKGKVAEAQTRAGRKSAPWIHVNDVAGFIGPEVFRTREQLVRCCLEDIVMAKLQGVMIGLDICTTLHMDVTLDDLDWCQDQIMPANPGYLIALPTKMDPMLGYLTTAYQDHVRIRDKFGYKVNDGMWRFYRRLGIIDSHGRPTADFGQPLSVWLEYRKAKGDMRSPEEIKAEGRLKMEKIRGRGVPLAEGHGKNAWDMSPELDLEIRNVYDDAKRCIRAELPVDFVNKLSKNVLATTSSDRNDYILHPASGEILNEKSRAAVRKFSGKPGTVAQVQIIVSDGLNANSISDPGNLDPYLAALRKELLGIGVSASKEVLVVINGRVRVGYRIGEMLFGELEDRGQHRGIIHIIGERPGSKHHTFSAYITAPQVNTWSKAGLADHNITRVVSGIAADAVHPHDAAVVSAKIVREFFGKVDVYTILPRNPVGIDKGLLDWALGRGPLIKK